MSDEINPHFPLPSSSLLGLCARSKTIGNCPLSSIGTKDKFHTNHYKCQEIKFPPAFVLLLLVMDRVDITNHELFQEDVA
jgi:hypothetical protein